MKPLDLRLHSVLLCASVLAACANLSDPAPETLDFSKSSAGWIRECRSTNELNLRVAQSLGSNLRGRSESCRHVDG